MNACRRERRIGFHWSIVVEKRLPRDSDNELQSICLIESVWMPRGKEFEWIFNGIVGEREMKKSPWTRKYSSESLLSTFCFSIKWDLHFFRRPSLIYWPIQFNHSNDHLYKFKSFSLMFSFHLSWNEISLSVKSESKIEIDGYGNNNQWKVNCAVYLRFHFCFHSNPRSISFVFVQSLVADQPVEYCAEQSSTMNFSADRFLTIFSSLARNCFYWLEAWAKMNSCS